MPKFILSARQFTLIFLFNSVLTCQSYNQTFICGDGTDVPFQELCNGVANCNDKSDEARTICFRVMYCKFRCPTSTFRCHYGACIDRSLVCDGKNDCADYSDESRCGRKSKSCEKDEFKCSTGECISNQLICNDIHDCKDGSDESENICDDFPCPKSTFRCRNGACIHLDALCDGFSDCIDNSDESDILCSFKNCDGEECDKVRDSIKCQPIVQSRIKATCKSSRGFVPCNKPIPVGTTVHYECLPHFVPINSLHKSNKQMVCQSDGTWSRKVLECKPDCGKGQGAATKLILHGKAVEAGEWPWYAAMYALEDGKWTFWCGGSIITEKAVLTAAHCTWSVTEDMLKVGVGKIFSDFSKSERGAQFRDVSDIHMHPLYQDVHGNFGSDIAMLVLNKAVEFSPTVRAVCLDWAATEYANHIRENSTGTVVGMGLTEKDVVSNRLKMIELPVSSNRRCIQQEKQDFKKYITYTAFCAGLINGSGVCNGDSGGGLSFPMQLNPNKWVLQGIVSVSPRRIGTSYCDPHFYTIFTKVTLYLRWIESTLNKIHPDIDNEDTEFLHSFAAPRPRFLDEVN